ncbi:TnpV protein [Dysosmobacter sp.]|uniref:TnpV protein n=1 Tax=Dysosmobacter sp. TaxID=2591382 RepID=UPI003AB46A2D
MEITYRKHEDFCVPNLLMHGSEPAAYGRFGRMRLKYLKEHRRAVYVGASYI